MMPDDYSDLDVTIPEPERHWFCLRCPRCRVRIWNQLYTTMLAYRVHYLMRHLIADLADDVTILAKGGNPRWQRERRVYRTR